MQRATSETRRAQEGFADRSLINRGPREAAPSGKKAKLYALALSWKNAQGSGGFASLNFAAPGAFGDFWPQKSLAGPGAKHPGDCWFFHICICGTVMGVNNFRCHSEEERKRRRRIPCLNGVPQNGGFLGKASE